VRIAELDKHATTADFSSLPKKISKGSYVERKKNLFNKKRPRTMCLINSVFDAKNVIENLSL